MSRRMFVEDLLLDGEGPRAACSRLMVELDRVAADEGYRVAGDVTVMEFEHALGPRSLRLEADVVRA